MTLDKDKEKKRMVSGLTYTLLAIGLALLLITPVTIMLTLNDGNEPEKITYDDPDGSISGDMSMDEASRDKWELFLSTAPSIEISTEPVSPIV
ncbi:MAG: hypothetical protein U9R75_01530, partial [Candidatus Thermoplasmatota archaeon]|nr:hypothetical protein [Candidatus Thermoplasmatota archaeon]